jgi:hypothetical protein
LDYYLEGTLGMSKILKTIKGSPFGKREMSDK